MVPEERMTGLRVPAGDDAALAAALIRLLSLPETARRAIGMRGRDWVIAHFDPATITSQMLAIYARIGRRRR
jgi:glycosyltransferase involved in cell wall biosynthesis